MLTLLLWMGWLLVIAIRDMLVYSMLGVASVLVGIFAYPILFINQNKGKIVALAIIFYPITMLVGIVDTAQELYCEVGGIFFE